MKRHILILWAFLAMATTAMAQSMTDQQVMEFYLEQRQQGVSQQQIVTKLIQRGVKIDQLQRIRKKYEQQQSGQGLGVVNITTDPNSSRLRQNNGQVPQDNTNIQRTTTYRRGNDPTVRVPNTFDDNDPEYMGMNRELSAFMPDSAELERMRIEEEVLMRNQRRVFGRDIFNNKNLTFEPTMNIATPQNYTLGPGDAVNVDVWGASQKSFQSTVSPDGTIQIEGFGPVSVAGLTVEQANARLRSQLGSRYQDSRIRLTVGQTKTIMVNVMGEVNVPGTYTLSAFATVFNALYMAGGISDIGTLRSIKVYRNNRHISTVDVYDYILNGNQNGNVRLADNDVIIVGPYESLVNITGKVKRPMFYEMKKTESVGALLNYAGGFTGDAYRKSVRIVRKAGSQYSVYNVSEFDLARFPVSDEDSVSVDSILPRYSNMVEIKGAVFRPGMYQVGGDIQSVRQLVETAEGVTEEAFTPHAILHRMKPDRTLEVLSVDLQGILSGSLADIPLRNEDVLFVPSKQEMQEEQTLTIHGEVRNPGVYKYAENETLEDFVLQAGGLTDAASVVKVDVARRLKNPSATSASDIIAQTYSFSLRDGFVIDGEAGFKLQPYDEVYVRTSPGYTKQQNVKVEGEVNFEGTYTLSKKNERLSELISQCGGLTSTAYAQGARLERRITTDERLRMQTVLKMVKAQSGEGDTLDVSKLDLGSTYYVGIHLDEAMAHPGGDEDIVLREGDRIIVPQYQGTVKISGDVMYPNTVAFREGEKYKYYIDQAGGWGNRAKKSHTYVIYMNGTVARVGRGTKITPGCEIIVPSKPKNSRLTLPEIMSIGTSTASIATMIASIANLLK
jgi:protein involved in polysaccharide export with SLBB domain